MRNISWDNERPRPSEDTVFAEIGGIGIALCEVIDTGKVATLTREDVDAARTAIRRHAATLGGARFSHEEAVILERRVRLPDVAEFIFRAEADLGSVIDAMPAQDPPIESSVWLDPRPRE